MSEDRPYQINKVTDKQFVIKAHSSWGILLINGGWGKAINVILQLYESKGNTNVSIKTNPRIEHYLILFLGLMFIGVSISQNELLEIYLFIIVIVILIHIWLHFIYRYQEKILIDKIKQELHLKEVETVLNKAQ